jgi:hypothetical protein
MNILKLVSQIFNPLVDLIDNLHTSTEEKLQQKAVLLDLQTRFLIKGVEAEQEALRARRDIIVAEAKGESWLQRNWRPISMLTFLVLIIADQTGMLAFRLAPEAWTLLQIGIGGYIVSRGVEKVAPNLLTALKKKDKV